MAELNTNSSTDPFADPSVQNAAKRLNIETEDYNPFATKSYNSESNSVTNSMMSNINQTTSKNIPIDSSDELFRRQEDLRKREEELQRRQQEFERRQQAFGRNGTRSGQPHNWPPIPDFIPIEPCFYQDIDVEIPVQFQETVRLIYYVYLIYVLALINNVISSLFYFLFANGSIGKFFLSIIELGLLTPCSFLFWFRPVYKAFRDDSSFNFMIFFMVLFMHSIFCFLQTTGLGDFAYGWSNTISVFEKNIFVGFVMLCCSLTFTAAFCGMVYSLLKVHRFYRGSGFTIDKARKEFSDNIVSDRNVQQAANQAARAAVSSAINEATSGRY